MRRDPPDEHDYDPHLHFELRFLDGTVDRHWYRQLPHVANCQPPVPLSLTPITNTSGGTDYRGYCGRHAERGLKSVGDPEQHLPPLPPAASSDLGDRAFQLEDVKIRASSAGRKLDIKLSASLSRPQFYDYTDDDWAAPDDVGGLKRTALPGLERSWPTLTGYRIRTTNECSQTQYTEFPPIVAGTDGKIPRTNVKVTVDENRACTVEVVGINPEFPTGFAADVERGGLGGFPVLSAVPHNTQLKVMSLTSSASASSGTKQNALKNFDLHFYVFRASYGTAITLSTRLGTVADLVLELKNVAGRTVAKDDVERGPDHLSWVVNVAGWYVLVVRGGYLDATAVPSAGTYWLDYTLTPARLCDIDTGPVGAATTPDESSSVRCVPRQPAALTVGNVTDNGATLSWSASSWAKGFEVQLDGEDVESTLGDSARSHPFPGLTPGKAHTLGVKATRDGLESAFATLTLLKPPSDIEQSTTAYNSVKYTWTDGNPTGSATGAEVKIGATGTRKTADSTTYHTFDNLSASTPYTFYIRLKNDQGPSAWRTATVTTPAQPRLPKPSGLSVTNVGQNSLTLNWSAVADAGGYKVKRTGSSSTWTLPSTSRSHRFTGLSSGTYYTLYVQALPKTGSSKLASAWAPKSRRTNSAPPPPTPQPPPQPLPPPLTMCLSSTALEAFATWFTDDSHCRSARASALWSALRDGGIEVGCISRLIAGSSTDPMWERYQAAVSRTNFLLERHDILWLSSSACPTGSGVSGSADAGALNCAEAVKPETGPAVVSAGGAACVIVRGGGAAQVSDGEHSLDLTLPN